MVIPIWIPYPVWIGNELPKPEGFYLGGGFQNTSITGDFDGKSSYTSSSDTIIVPKIKSGSGYCIFGGVHITESWDVEMGYFESNHDSKWMNETHEAKATSLNFDVKYNFSTSIERLKPFVVFGAGMDTIFVSGGASDGSTVREATYYGYGLNFGVGVNYFLNSNVSFGASYTVRSNIYDEASGTGTRGLLNESIDADSITFAVITTYHFSKQE